MAQSRPRLARSVALIGAGAAVAMRIRRAGWFPVRVEGDSMQPTLPPGALVAVSPLRNDPAFGSVVVLRRANGAEHIKRIVAVPGDRFRAGSVEVTLGDRQYAVVGDDRARSTDSRHHGPVDREAIVGVARVCYWPPRAWRLFSR